MSRTAELRAESARITRRRGERAHKHANAEERAELHADLREAQERYSANRRFAPPAGCLSNLETLALERREARGRFADRVLRRLRDE